MLGCALFEQRVQYTFDSLVVFDLLVISFLILSLLFAVWLLLELMCGFFGLSTSFSMCLYFSPWFPCVCLMLLYLN